MWRTLHSLQGLFSALLFIVIAISGAILSISPVLERSSAIVPAWEQITVAQLAERVIAHYPGTEQIKRLPSGEVIVYYINEDSPGAVLVNPITGQGIDQYQPSPFFRWIKDLHRTFLLGDSGRILAGVIAVLMMLMCVSGTFILARRTGGWRALLQPLKGSGDHRIHSELARFAVIGLLLSSLTGSYLSAVRFGLLPKAAGNEPSFPAKVLGGTPAAIGSLKTLKNTDLNNLRELVFPYPDDPQDVFSINTDQGAGFIDPATGELLKFAATSPQNQLHNWIVRLHTGEDLWWLSLILGAAAFTVPILSISGIRIWWLRRRRSNHAINNVDKHIADTVILVGSESNTTWGFANELHQQMTAAGHKVHAAKMNLLANEYPKASMLFVLTSTYGDGDAPTSANMFMERLKHFTKTDGLSFAVLGFGDQQFSHFCQFAVDVDKALDAIRLARLEAVTLIDRQSTEQFNQWGKRIAALTNVPLELTHNPTPFARFTLELVDRTDFGVAIQAPTSILRFASSTNKKRVLKFLENRKKPLPDFDAGDLVGVFPPNEPFPRYYSLASSSKEGLIEICVRKQPHGLCSGYLHNLQVGDHIQGFIQHNLDFRPTQGNIPIILIGAGTGIAPLAGFIKKNNARQPMYLYWGGRNPEHDFLYQSELNHYLKDQRLTGLNTAFSRTQERAYVQDKIVEDAANVREIIEKGAQILVCGGREMASGVKQAINNIAMPLDIDVDKLKRDGRYLEDIY